VGEIINFLFARTSRRRRPDLRRDCDSATNSAIDFTGAFRRRRPDLRRDCDIEENSPLYIFIIMTTKTWFTKGLRLGHCTVLNIMTIDDEDLIYEGIATSAFGPNDSISFNSWRRRPDLRRDCDTSSTVWHSINFTIDDEDLIYEGIATDAVVHIFCPLFVGRRRPDLRRDCDWPHKNLQSFHQVNAQTTKTWFTKGLRLLSVSTCFVTYSAGTTKTWFTKGLRPYLLRLWLHCQ